MFTDAAPVFAALGDETRLRLVARLVETGPRSIAALTEGTGVSRQAVTKHLKTLAEAGLVEGEVRGRERVWSARLDGVDEAMQYLAQISSRWDRAIDRLQIHIDGKAH